jgi:hypothetical protein
MPRVPYSLNSYTGGAPTAALAAAVSITGTSISIVNTSSGWYPLGVSGGFFLALDYGTALEEKVFVPSGAYNWLAGVTTVQTISGITRAQDNTNAVAHVSGSITAFVMTGVDLAEANLAVSQTLGQATTATSGYAYFSNGSGLAPYAIQPGRITGLSAGAIPFGSATGAWSDTSISGGGTGSAGQLLMSYGNIANTGPKWVSFPVHPAVQVVSTTNIAGTYTANGNSTNDAPLLVDTFTVTATGNVTIDGYIVQLGDRILLAGQTTSSQNGIYLCTTFGNTGVSAVFVRDNDADTVGKLTTALVQVRQGIINIGTTWQCQISPNGTIGVSACPFTQLLTPTALASGQTFGYATLNNVNISGGTSVGVTNNNTTFVNPVFTSAKETVTLVSSPALNGTVTFSGTLSTINYYTVAATNNFTFNLTTSGTINSTLPVGQSITFTALALQGNPAYMTASGAPFQIDGSTTGFTTYWQGGTAPASGNVNQIDVYTFTIIKTAATPTYTVLASQTKF